MRKIRLIDSGWQGRLSTMLDAGSELNADDPWRPMNVYVHAPGAIGQTMKAIWYKYDSTGQNPATPCDSGEYYYLYDALGNVENQGLL